MISKRTYPNPGGKALVDLLMQEYSTCDGFTVLESGWLDDSPESSIVFLEPGARFSCHEGHSYVDSADGNMETFSDPWEALRRLQNLLPVDDAPVPYCAGFLSYELLHQIEVVPRTGTDRASVPDYCFYSFRTVLIVPHSCERPIVQVNFFENDGTIPWWSAGNIEGLIARAHAQKAELAPSMTDGLSLSQIAAELAPYSNFSRAAYISSVEKIRSLIYSGEVYQVNLSQLFSLPWNGDPIIFWQKLREAAKARYGAYQHVAGIHGSSPFTILSSSPELFLHAQGGRMSSSPIKGTRPRASSPHEDYLLIEELSISEKDHAELAMIVDLIRNDMGRVAQIGTVQVQQHLRLESLTYVHQMVSDVSCDLESSAGLVEIIRALFPCGSITGAPKIAAMKAISSLENTRRGIYTGAIGFICPNRTFKFNVAIRTAVIQESRLEFSCGGGIVYDSDPSDEYDETLAKARALHRACQ